MTPLTFHIEAIDQFVPQAIRLIKNHYGEVGEAQLTQLPNFELYNKSAQAGILLIVGARHESELVGYAIFTLGPSLEYANLVCAYENTYYLDPAARKGLTALTFIDGANRLAKAAGAQRVYWHSDENRPVDSLFKYLKYKKFCTVYVKDLSDV